jgi:hypothetical protein
LQTRTGRIVLWDAHTKKSTYASPPTGFTTAAAKLYRAVPSVALDQIQSRVSTMSTVDEGLKKKHKNNKGPVRRGSLQDKLDINDVNRGEEEKT